MERILLDSMTIFDAYRIYYTIFDIYSPISSLFLTPIPNLRVLFYKRIGNKKILFHGKRKCLQPLEFLPSFSAGLTGRRVHCLYETRRSIVPVQCSWFLRSRMCPRAYFVRLHARIVHWLTDTRLSANTYITIRIHGCLPEWTSLGLGWKKRILLDGQIAVAFCEKSMWNISVSRWGGQERRRSRGLDATILWWMWWNSLKN